MVRYKKNDCNLKLNNKNNWCKTVLKVLGWMQGRNKQIKTCFTKYESLSVHNILYVIGADIILYYSFHKESIILVPNIPTDKDDTCVVKEKKLVASQFQIYHGMPNSSGSSSTHFIDVARRSWSCTFYIDRAISNVWDKTIQIHAWKTVDPVNAVCSIEVNWASQKEWWMAQNILASKSNRKNWFDFCRLQINGEVILIGPIFAFVNIYVYNE